jgi:mutator protein MutT
MITAAYPFYIKEGKILLGRRINTGYADGMYSLPAGHVEDGETLANCVVREAKEEIGVDIREADLDLVHVMHRKEEDTRVDFFFFVKKWKGTPTICEPDKCDDLTWFALDTLPENTVPYIRSAIEQWQKGIIYSNFGW